MHNPLLRAAVFLGLPIAEGALVWFFAPPARAFFPAVFFLAVLALLAVSALGAPRLRCGALGVHGALLFLTAAVSLSSASPWLIGACLAVAWLSAFCVWTPASSYLVHPLASVLVPGSLLVGLSLLYDRSPGALWERLGGLTAAAVSFLSALLPGAVTWTNAQGNLMVSFHSFVANIGKGCWGMESFFLFTLAYLVVHSFVAERLGRRGWFFCYVAALPLLYVVNAVRIVLAVGIGGTLVATWGVERGNALFETFVHPYLGLLLYAATFALYAFYWSKQLSADGEERENRREVQGPAHLVVD